MEGCQYCVDLDPHENVNVTQLYESNEYDIKLFRCNKCSSYFELRGDEVIYVNQKHIDMAYHGASFMDKSHALRKKIAYALLAYTAVIIVIAVFTADFRWLFGLLLSMYLMVFPLSKLRENRPWYKR